MVRPTVDAIVCYHNHHDSIVRCLDSIKNQVRQAILVDDGSDPSFFNAGQGPRPRSDWISCLRRDPRHGVANSFNYGAMHSNADYFLYVDPHCTFKPKAVANLLKAVGTEYRFALGTGDDVLLDPTDPWAPALASISHPRIPLTFLIHHAFWEHLHGIPEPPYCHMEILASELFRRGERIARVDDVCTHRRLRPFWQAVGGFWQAGYSYGALHAAGYPNAYGREVDALTPAQIALYTKLLFACAHRLGVLTGTGRVPQGALPGVDDARFEWVYWRPNAEVDE